MNLSIGILLSAVSSITSPANCSAVWYAHKHPLVCAVFISISVLTLFGILLGMGCLCLLLLYRNEVICPLSRNSCWHLLHPKFLAELRRTLQTSSFFFIDIWQQSRYKDFVKMFKFRFLLPYRGANRAKLYRFPSLALEMRRMQSCIENGHSRRNNTSTDDISVFI